jgi:hypothetical protein
MSYRGVNLQRLACDILLAVACQMGQRAHVVQTVGKLDQHDADVARHRDDHLAEVLRLLLGAAGKCDFRNLGNAVNQRRDLGSEQLAQLVDRRDRVLDHVVQQAGDDRGQVEPELRDNHRDVERMGDVGLARFARLLGVHPRRVLVGAANQVSVGLRIVRLDQTNQFFQPGGRGDLDA